MYQNTTQSRCYALSVSKRELLASLAKYNEKLRWTKSTSAISDWLTFGHISNLCVIFLDSKLFTRTEFLALPDTKSSIQQMLKAVEKFIPRTNICFRWFYTCKTISVISFTSQRQNTAKDVDIKNTLISFFCLKTHTCICNGLVCLIEKWDLGLWWKTYWSYIFLLKTHTYFRRIFCRTQTEAN